MDYRRKIVDLAALRNTALADAEHALEANDEAAYGNAMNRVRELNDQIQQNQDIQNELDRQFDMRAPSAAENRDMVEDRAETLRRGDDIKISMNELRKAIRNSVTLASGTLVEPVGAGTNIHDPVSGGAGSLIDQVMVQDMTGFSAWQEPYVISESDAKVGKVAANAGQSRTASADPVFGIAEIKPYEMNVTSFVDRNISRLSPADYYAKIYNMAMRALRRKANALATVGDSETSHVMYGIVNGVNKAGSAIYATETVSSVDVNLLDSLYFAYGDNEAIGPNARLFLTKADLKAIGQLRGTNEKRRLMEIRPDPANPNTGIISDGGVLIPYTICADLTSLSTATAGAAAIPTMVYGDPQNYMLGLFGDFSIRVDESFKAQERLLTILGDAMIGGNLVAHHGMVVATVAATSG